MGASNVAEIYNGIILDFYIGLPHFIVGVWTSYEVSRFWLLSTPRGQMYIKIEMYFACYRLLHSIYFLVGS